MMKNIFSLLAICIAFAANAQEKMNIRGQILTTNPYTKETIELSNADVVIYSKTKEGWAVVDKTITSPQGLYYFYNITEADYYLQVNGMKNFLIQVRMPAEGSQQKQQMQQMQLRRDQMFVDVPVVYF